MIANSRAGVAMFGGGAFLKGNTHHDYLRTKTASKDI